MRKRSNAFESDSLQNYLKVIFNFLKFFKVFLIQLAILSQKHQNHFSRGKVLEKEEEKHEYMSTSRRYSIDFDYESPKSPDSYQMFSNSFPPKDENELFKPKKIANVKLIFTYLPILYS